jgi:hypothetical protein
MNTGEQKQNSEPTTEEEIENQQWNETHKLKEKIEVHTIRWHKHKLTKDQDYSNTKTRLK